ncbi:MAG: hypothetical protein ACR2NX_08525 [Chthoniobacterales bacterium]
MLASFEIVEVYAQQTSDELQFGVLSAIFTFPDIGCDRLGTFS